VAKTEALKTGISGIMIALSGLWFWTYGEANTVWSPYFWMPVVFALTGVISALIHSVRWLRSKGIRVLVEKDIVKLNGEDLVARTLEMYAAKYLPRPPAPNAEEVAQLKAAAGKLIAQK
jgi:hypothetical protein